MSERKASAAQAKTIARLWGDGAATCRVGGFEIPTVAVCVKRGWLVPNGKTGTFPSGAPWTEHVVSERGLDALEDYLRDTRYKRSRP
jgi:hypothetical protein